MNAAKWLACADPYQMLVFLSGKVSPRKFQLFAVACCRRVWHRLPDPRSRRAIEMTERFIEGEATVQEMQAACREAEAAQQDARQKRRGDAGECAAVALALTPEWNADRWPCVSSVASRASVAAAQFAELSGTNRKERRRNWVRGLTDEQAAQSNLLRDLVGNPFHPISLDPTWLTSTVSSLAHAAYEHRVLPLGTLDPLRLAVLADALEEAGCDDARLLVHLRGPGQHWRGCFAVDLCLEKE